MNDKLSEIIDFIELVDWFEDVNDKFLIFSEIVDAFDEFAPIMSFCLKKDSTLP